MELIGGLAFSALFVITKAVGAADSEEPQTLTAEEDALDREWMKAIR
jgi:hypothetical protein